MADNEVRIIDLRGNHLHSLPAAIFSQFSRLHSLVAGDNNMQRVPDAVVGLSQLRVLSLTKNQIVIKNQHPFATLTSLEFLDLSFNNLARLSKGDFVGLEKVTVLILDSNDIAEVEEETFTDIPLLKALYIKHNRLSTEFFNKAIISGLPRLTTLNVYGNSINEPLRPGVFQSIRQLELLDMGFNNLEPIANGTFKGLTSLVMLSLKYTTQKIMNGAFSDLSALKELILDHNQLKGVQSSLWLGVGGTLEVLHMKYCELYDLEEGAFAYLTSLRELSLIGNPLHVIPDITPLIHLNKLYLTDTTISQVYPCQLPHLSHSMDVQLGSGLVCDCQLAWMKMWYDQSNYEKIYEQSRMYVCAYPRPYQGLQFSELMLDDFKCAAGTQATWCGTHHNASISMEIEQYHSHSVIVRWKLIAMTGQMYDVILQYNVLNRAEDMTSRHYGYNITGAVITNVRPGATYHICVSYTLVNSSLVYANSCMEYHTGPHLINKAVIIIAPIITLILIAIISLTIYISKKKNKKSHRLVQHGSNITDIHSIQELTVSTSPISQIILGADSNAESSV